eukprot:359944-Chlamydomonas_euryale.AAC.7
MLCGSDPAVARLHAAPPQKRRTCPACVRACAWTDRTHQGLLPFWQSRSRERDAHTSPLHPRALTPQPPTHALTRPPKCCRRRPWNVLRQSELPKHARAARTASHIIFTTCHIFVTARRPRGARRWCASGHRQAGEPSSRGGGAVGAAAAPIRDQAAAEGRGGTTDLRPGAAAQANSAA